MKSYLTRELRWTDWLICLLCLGLLVGLVAWKIKEETKTPALEWRMPEVPEAEDPSVPSGPTYYRVYDGAPAC